MPLILNEQGWYYGECNNCSQTTEDIHQDFEFALVYLMQHMGWTGYSDDMTFCDRECMDSFDIEYIEEWIKTLKS